MSSNPSLWRKVAMLLPLLSLRSTFHRTQYLFPSLLIAGVALGCARSSRAVHMQSIPAAPPLSGATPGAIPGAIPVATGSGVIALPEPKGPIYDITTYGARPDGPALENQKGINAAIVAASTAGGGTVVIPSGTFKSYSIRMKSNVGLRFAAPDSVLQAAVPGTGESQDGGFYDAPEVNLFVGLQDGGHSHWANSLISIVDANNIMISGPGLIDGGRRTSGGLTEAVLSAGDPREASDRTVSGTRGSANKAIGLKNAHNIVFRDFRIRNGGHMAILGSGVIGWTVDGIVVDTNRDAIDVDTCQNVTIRNSVFNSLNDDAIVMKGSFGIGKYLPTKNILIEKDTVSGYDPGSVLDKTYSTQKLVAADRDGPTGRVKFGTEGSSGLDTMTVRDVTFDRSRGFALESVDGAEIKNVIFENVHMKNVSSSPIFLRIGDRGRAPVTGSSASDAFPGPANARLDDPGWVLPKMTDVYGSWPARRYIPSYNKTKTISIAGAATPFRIVDPDFPTQLNPNSIVPTDPLYANAVGVGFATIHDVLIDHVTVEDADPRYPILLAGLMDHPIRNITISNLAVEFRGGLRMEDAIQQRQLSQPYTFSAYQAAPATQFIPRLVNTFFSKNEALLPRIGWNPILAGGAGGWVDDPYNVPEMPREYPEPSMFGILPGYGLYARHVDGLTTSNIDIRFKVEDERPAVVLDDVQNATFSGFSASVKFGVPVFVKITNTRKREPDREYVKEAPYKTTTVNNLVTPRGLTVQSVTVDRPAPGTPPDSMYRYPTAPDPAYPYAYNVPDAAYSRVRRGQPSDDSISSPHEK
jgi:polygalacturonase